MLKINSFGIIGGDKRQLYCAHSISNDGYSVLLAGFDNNPDLHKLKNSDTSDVIEHSDALILPLPISKNGTEVFAPYSSSPIMLSDLVIQIPPNKPVFCGINGAVERSELLPHRLYRYSSREEFAAANAVPTAEGAIGIAIQKYDGTINGSRCLVIGYGKIGRILSRMLQGFGADITVAARQLKDREFILAAGMKACSVTGITEKYDIIFNTVPALVLDSHTLAKCALQSIVIDLASLPGGVDDEAAERMSVKVIHALSLPGKTAPKTAGVIIKSAVYNIIEEEII